MLRFFRRIRKTIINSGNTRKYFLYAIGEIILIVIGILIALQINNWNVNRSEKVNFELILDEIESNLLFDVAELSFETKRLQNRIRILKKFLYSPAEISNDSLDYFTGTLMDKIVLNIQTTGVEQLRNAKIINYSSPILIEWITTYYGFTEKNDDEFQNLVEFRTYLAENGLPPPPYTEKDSEEFKTALGEANFQNYLRHLINMKEEELRNWQFYLTNGKFTLNQVQNRNNLSYKVELAGASIQNADQKFIELELLKNNKWGKTISLNDGEVRFRIQNAGFQNWGGNNFPKGVATLYGPSVPVKEGQYQMTFDIVSKEYSFYKIN